MNLDHGIHELITLNKDGSYTIFLNARDSRERQVMSYYHALGHIENRDFEKSDVQEIEHEAHKSEVNYERAKR